ncbi:MAG: DNA polymerase-3 subunit alpha [Oceanospirillaceae bacterium]|jgi:DNA polymerase-3 subunit alpha
MYLIYDTETTGLPKNYKAPLTDGDNWPRLVQLAWQLHEADGALVESGNIIVKPKGFDIPFNSEQIHGISTEKALAEGIDLKGALDQFSEVLSRSKVQAGHNIEFDINIVGAEYIRVYGEESLTKVPSIDTKNESTNYCEIPGGRGGQFKWPKLTELHEKLFGEAFEEAHNAAADVAATARCFLELIRIRVITHQKAQLSEDELRAFLEKNPAQIQAEKINVGTQVADQKKRQEKTKDTSELAKSIDHDFAHLHVHSQYSVLQSTIYLKNLVNRAIEFGMPGVAVTDHANMFGTFHFVSAINDANEEIDAHNEKVNAGDLKAPLKKSLKGIVGCEFYVTDDHTDKTHQNNGYQVVFLAKNKKGYHNLAKMCSISYMDGFYYVPRIDKDVVLQYKDDLIITTGGLGGEISDLILNTGEKQAEEALLWWKEHFGEDFYIELLNHNLPEEKHANKVLLQFAEKHDIKYFPSNNVYYLNQEDSEAHDILLCVKEGVKRDDNPEIARGRAYIKKRFPNDQFYFKSQDEMKALFADKPEAFETIEEILDKVEPYSLKQDVLLPVFDIPEEFKDAEDLNDGGKRGENAYLRHLTYEGAKKRYGEITDDIRERLDFELLTIANSGYPGYFLIVQDFTSEARKMGVAVGPGRGSAAGSAVAYCIWITNVDPIAYDLLFERFLNPDRISLPDIDIDFDDEGRGKVIDWVVAKYGKNQVAQIITYGTLGGKSALRDTARVLDLPLSDADRIAKLVPDIKLNKIFSLDDKGLKAKLNGDQDKMAMAQELKELANGSDLTAETINQALVLEGSVRNTGIHACGVIITPDDITNHIPVSVAKDSDLAVTQFDNSVVESAGMLKMDFLGLKTLSIIKDAIKLIKDKHDVDIDPDTIPLDDQKTYELYQRGDTNGTFQFESAGMQKHLKDLKPDKFADLIAMNALYRPGPLKYIPNFIKRKHGEEEIVYDLPEMEEYLAETYGISVYQEQVMRLSQKLANFSKGDADVLRKAMGKKNIDLLKKMNAQFLEGCEANGHDLKIADKVWSDWEEFAAYAFNKSHSTCYSVVAFHTAYLKANYPAEYMASVLTHNMNDIKKVTFFMEECKRMGMAVLGPDVNESQYKFAVNTKGQIRFGLGAVKGVGEGAVEALVEERKENGSYMSIFDLTKRIDLKSTNRRALEGLAHSGALDSFENAHRAVYFHEEGNSTFMEKAVKFGQAYQHSLNSAQVSLFGEGSDESMPEPTIPHVEKWNVLKELSLEKDVVGIYISGHPLDQHKLAITSFNHRSLREFNVMEPRVGMDIRFGGLVTSVAHRMTKTQKPFGVVTIEDYEDSHELAVFGEEYAKFKGYFIEGVSLSIKGTYQKGWGENSPPRFKVMGIEFLSELLEKNTRKITVTIPLSKLDGTMINDLETMAENYPGKCNLHFKILAKEPRYNIEFRSKKFRIRPEQELIQNIQNGMDLNVELG